MSGKAMVSIVIIAVLGLVLYAVGAQRFGEQSERIEEQNERIEGLNVRLERVRAELEDAEARVKAHDESAGAEAALREAIADRDRLRAENEALKSRWKAESGEGVARFTELYEDLKSHLAEEETERETLNEMLVAYRSDVERAEAALNEAVTARDNLRAENEALKSRWKAESNEGAARSERFTELYEDLRSRLAEKESEREALNRILEAYRSDMEHARAALNEAVAARDNLLELLAQARSRAERTDELEARLARANLEIARRTASLEEEQGRIVAMELELRNLDVRRAELVRELEARDDLVARLNREREAARAELEALRARMEEIASGAQFEVNQLRERVTLIRMQGDIVFREGSTRINESGRAILDRVAEYAATVPERILSLEGHTDNVPIAWTSRKRYPSNWELSAARAASAARYLQGRGVAPERLRIVGYGEYRAVGDNADDRGRARNRRLEIVLAPEAPFEALRGAER